MPPEELDAADLAGRACASAEDGASSRPRRAPRSSAAPRATSAAGRLPRIAEGVAASLRASRRSPSQATSAAGRPAPLSCPLPMDERALAERLITYDTSTPDGLRAPPAFVKGWLESRDIDVTEHDTTACPCSLADVGPAGRARRSILHGHLDVVPGLEEQFTPRVEGDRLIGRGAYDMKGALAAMMCAVQDVADAGRASACASVRARRGVRGRRATARPTRSSRDGLRGRLRDHRRADGPAHRRPGQGRARGAHRGARHAPPTARRRGWATTRSSRRTTSSAGSRRCPSPRVLRPVRPPVDQPRPHRGRRRLQQGARPLRRWTSTSATCPARTPARSSRRSARSPTSRSSRTFTPRAGDRLAHEPVRARAARRRRPLDRGRGAERRPRRRLGRDLVPRGRHPGRRVRPDRRRPPRPRGVGLDRLAAHATARRSATSSAQLPERLGVTARRRPALRRSREAAREPGRPPRARAAADLWRRFLARRASIDRRAARAASTATAGFIGGAASIVDGARAWARRSHDRRRA